jgi:hypothetical protein
MTLLHEAQSEWIDWSIWKWVFGIGMCIAFGVFCLCLGLMGSVNP